jgi:hypothetical protein
MTAPVEDVSSLPGQTVSDQQENPIGEVKEIFATDDGYPMWVSVELSQGIGDKRIVFIPLARLKDEDGDLRVPYSKNHIAESPEIDGSDGISEECDRELRVYYGIDAGDQELRADNKSYAALVPDEAGSAERVENADEVETPDADKRTDETKERLQDPGSAEMRNVTADDVVDEGKDDTGSKEGGSEDKSESKDDAPEGKSESKAGDAESESESGQDDSKSKSESDDE